MALPKAQAFSESKIKTGAVLYLASAYTGDDRKTSSEIQEWHIRSIRAKRGSKSRFVVAPLGLQETEPYVNLTRKLDLVTWGKLSSKTGDYGWLKSIPKWCTEQFKVGSDLPRGYYTTPRAAVTYAIADTEEHIAKLHIYLADETSPAGFVEWQQEIADSQQQLAALKRRLSSLKSK